MPDSNLIQRRVFVSGKVQGVGYRQSTVREASARTGMRGWVKNLSDGRVEIVFSGPEEQVLALVAWCRSGPPSGAVTRIRVVEESLDASLMAFHMIRE